MDRFYCPDGVRDGGRAGHGPAARRICGNGFRNAAYRIAVLHDPQKNGTVTYAVNLNERFRLNGQAPVVVYGFVAGKLFAAYVRLDGLIDRAAMVKRLEVEFGKPSVAKDDGATVLRWRRGKVKVKLKSNPATGSLKLGYYSVAKAGVAEKLLDLDNVDIGGIAKLYEKNKVGKDIPQPAKPAPKSYSPLDDTISKSVNRMQ